jgi:hypothetical protein
MSVVKATDSLLLRDLLPKFLPLLQDEDLVRRRSLPSSARTACVTY